VIQVNGCKYRERRRLAAVPVTLAATTVLALAAINTAPASTADDPDDALNALMMGGTGMPVPSSEWVDSIITDYIDPATGASYTAQVVPTPANLPVDLSVHDGLADLQTAMAAQQLADPGAPYVIEGYSMSALIAVDEEEQLASTATAGQPVPDVTVALFGSGNRPNGGIYERLDGLYVPGLGVDANGAEPTDLGFPTIDVADQYDGLADVPQYPANLVADLNDLLGIIYVHTSYGDGAVPGLFPDSTPLSGPFADEYVLGSTEIVKQVTGDATYYLVPTQTLPLLDPLLDLAVPQSVLNIVQPALQVVVEAGYDRFIPFGDPTPFELIPSIDPATFSLEFANGVVQGANNALGLFGLQLPDFTGVENFFNSAEAWSEANVGVPYENVVSELNTAVNPFTLAIDLERPIGEGIEDLLTATGVQQAIDPILALIGPLGELFTG
jgi:PE-PPE domain